VLRVHCKPAQIRTSPTCTYRGEVVQLGKLLRQNSCTLYLLKLSPTSPLSHPNSCSLICMHCKTMRSRSLYFESALYNSTHVAKEEQCKTTCGSEGGANPPTKLMLHIPPHQKDTANIPPKRYCKVPCQDNTADSPAKTIPHISPPKRYRDISRQGDLTFHRQNGAASFLTETIPREIPWPNLLAIMLSA
jgi:hypothetical protein